LWLSAVTYGCSSSTTTTTPSSNNNNTTGTAGDAGKKPGSGNGTGTGTGGGNGGGPSTGDDGGTPAPTAGADNTVGTACTADSTCDVTGQKITMCSSDAFTAGTLMPSPVCIGVTCDPGDGTQIMGCDNDHGVCLKTAKGGLCLPACSFANDGKAPQGCNGKDACNVMGFGQDQTGAIGGIGFCLGGCAADADCTAGNKCDTISGLCLKTVTAPTKKTGDACVAQDTGCNCYAGNTTQKGYCTQFCRVGGTTCGTGFVCSAQLPKTSGDGGALFSQQPTDIAGSCLKTCTTDADCTALSAKCDLTDVGGGVCVPQ
jgi:hypothetical protein